MRLQGKITEWKDDQGFGFVVPNGGGEKAFVHMKAFSGRARRPIEGDLITYEPVPDEKRDTRDKRRIRAENIRFVERATATAPHKQGTFGTIFTVLFCSFLALAVRMGWIPFAILGLYLAASILAFLAYAIDKSAARNNRWRTQESTLHLFGLIGGWPGALFAQKTLRHKSKKEAFQTVYWATVTINCLALGWLLTKSGSSFLSTSLGLAT